MNTKNNIEIINMLKQIETLAKEIATAKDNKQETANSLLAKCEELSTYIATEQENQLSITSLLHTIGCTPCTTNTARRLKIVTEKVNDVYSNLSLAFTTLHRYPNKTEEVLKYILTAMTQICNQI